MKKRSAIPPPKRGIYCKLLYQSEFGAGHMAMDAEAGLARLRAECAACGAGEDEPFTDVGGGLVRLHLRALPALKLRLETVNGLFARACAPRGSVAGLEAKLELLRANAARLGLNGETLEAELAAWRAAGYPALSHSRAYRDLYHPAYRLVPAAARRFLALFQAIDALLQRQRARPRSPSTATAARANPPSARCSPAVYGGNLYHMDDFFLPPQRKTRERLAEPGGNVDRERFFAEVLSRLGTAFSYRPWRCHEGALAAPVACRAAGGGDRRGRLQPAPRPAQRLRSAGVPRHPSQGAGRAHPRPQRRGACSKRFVREWIPLENAYFAHLGVRACCQLAFDGAAQ